MNSPLSLARTVKSTQLLVRTDGMEIEKERENEKEREKEKITDYKNEVKNENETGVGDGERKGLVIEVEKEEVQEISWDAYKVIYCRREEFKCLIHYFINCVFCL